MTGCASLYGFAFLLYNNDENFSEKNFHVATVSGTVSVRIKVQYVYPHQQELFYDLIQIFMKMWVMDRNRFLLSPHGVVLTAMCFLV